MIEVFDVVVKSKQRLQLFNLDKGVEYISSPELSDYMTKMDHKFNPQN